MSNATPAQLKAFYSEFGSVADEVVQLFLDAAFAEMNQSRWSASSKPYAEMALAAHLMTVNGVLGGGSGGGAGAGVGAIQSMSVGDVSVTYATSTSSGSGAGASEDALKSTRYGLDYLRRLKNQGWVFYVPGSCQ